MGSGANVNEVDLKNDDKFTPLHWAAHAGSLEVRTEPGSPDGRAAFLSAISVCIGFSGSRQTWMLKHTKGGHRRTSLLFEGTMPAFK